MRFSNFALIIAAALPCQAQAQLSVRDLPNLDYGIATKYGDNVAGHESVEDYQENLLENLAQCALLNNRSAVDRTLTLQADSEAYLKSLISLASTKCLRSGNYSLQPSAFRSALFRELYRSEFKRSPTLELRNSVTYWKDIGNPASDFGKAYLVSRQLADCVVVADSRDSRKLVLLKIGDSHEEDKVFASLVTALQHCLPAGQTVSIDKYQMTGWIAEALYRESKLALAAGATGGKR